MKIEIIPILSDNYAYIIQSDGVTAIVDPGEAAPIIEYCEDNNLTPDIIINTHHHWDHTDGNVDIIQKYNCKVIAPAAEKNKIGQVDIELFDGDSFTIGKEEFVSIETAGHTQGHLCFYNEKNKILFSGDMVFLMGCGRPIEGSAADLFKSVQKLSHLSDDTKIYCGHEYTIKNAQFAQTIEPNNDAINSALLGAEKKYQKGIPTVPTSMGQERKTNPFIRAKTEEEFTCARDARNKF